MTLEVTLMPTVTFARTQSGRITTSSTSGSTYPPRRKFSRAYLRNPAGIHRCKDTLLGIRVSPKLRRQRRIPGRILGHLMQLA
jgi:hypothetical protein